MEKMFVQTAENFTSGFIFSREYTSVDNGCKMTMTIMDYDINKSFEEQEGLNPYYLAIFYEDLKTLDLSLFDIDFVPTVNEFKITIRKNFSGFGEKDFDWVKKELDKAERYIKAFREEVLDDLMKQYKIT